MKTSLLHLYAQSFEHAEAWVVGSKEGLKALRDVIDKVLTGDEASECADVEVVDGEGYKLLVVQTDKKELYKKEVSLPYANATYQGKYPIVLVGPSRYRELMLRPEPDESES